MATNNAVAISAGLMNTAATPNIGSGVQTVTLAFTEGHIASEDYVDVATSPTPLNASLGGDGYILVVNQSVQAVTILGVAQSLGVLQAATVAGGVGGICLIPVATGIIINATVPGTTGQVYVARIRVSANA